MKKKGGIWSLRTSHSRSSVLLREEGGFSGVRSLRGFPASCRAPETGWCIGATCNNLLDADLRMRFTSCSSDTVDNLIDDLKVN